MIRKINRNCVLGVRANSEFIDKLDDLCFKLGHNRSEVVRYCLNRFLYENLDSENFRRAQVEMF
jgi:hypothetical protein